MKTFTYNKEPIMEKILNDRGDVSNSTDISLTNDYQFYRNLIFKTIENMKIGSIRFIDPDGTRTILGDTSCSSSFHGSIIRILNPIFYKKCVLYGDIGFAESYMDGDWETDNISSVLNWLIVNVDNNPVVSGSKIKTYKVNLLNFFNKVLHRFRDNSVTGSKKNIAAHYDLGNNLYQLFLDETMTYSSAKFTGNNETLQEAQLAKYDSLCKMLQLNSSHSVLEIGSGWGGFSIYAAKNYGCKITTVTISQEQFAYAKKQIEQEGLSHQITIQLKDYRYITGKYDRIVSIEMLEAVGDKYYETFFAKCNEVLEKNGMLGFQVITCPDSRYKSIKNGVDFIQKYIFPGSLIPSLARLNKAINKTGDLFMHELIDMGTSYAKTLKIWRTNFEKNLQEVRRLGYDERFIKMWRYYLSYCESAFFMRNLSVVQTTYIRPNNISIE